MKKALTICGVVATLAVFGAPAAPAQTVTNMPYHCWASGRWVCWPSGFGQQGTRHNQCHYNGTC